MGDARAAGRPSSDRQLQLPPTSRPGRWAGRALVAFVVAIVAMQVAVASGQRGGESLLDNWWLTGPALAAALSAVGALAAGAVAIVRRDDHSMTVVLAVALGTVVSLFVLGELAAPH